MARLPDADRAVADLRKLTMYALNPEHPEGGAEKAAAFNQALGLTQSDASWLRERLLEAVAMFEAEFHAQSPFGRLYRIDFPLTVGERTATIRSGWIVRHDESFPRLTTCFVRHRGRHDEADNETA